MTSRRAARMRPATHATSGRPAARAQAVASAPFTVVLPCCAVGRVAWVCWPVSASASWRTESSANWAGWVWGLQGSDCSIEDAGQAAQLGA